MHSTRVVSTRVVSTGVVSTRGISCMRLTELSCAKFNTQMLVIQNWNIQLIGKK